MPVALHPTWHPMMVHIAMGMTLGSSILVITGLIASIIGFREYAEKLTYPLHATLLLAIISLVLACASALIDFPASSFASSPWFRFKTIVSIVTFFMYASMYLLVALRKNSIWKNPVSLSYMVLLAIIGGVLVVLLGAAGGYMEYGHSALESLLKALGLPMPRL